MLPRRRGGRGWHFEQGRFLTRTQLGKLLSEIPAEWRPFFDLLASTGLRISEAIALRWCDLELGESAHAWVRRSVVDGVVGAPKSRFGRRRVPIDQELAAAWKRYKAFIERGIPRLPRQAWVRRCARATFATEC